MYKHILIASGGAEHSRNAEKRAVELAKICNANLTLISVVRNKPLPLAVGAEFGMGGATLQAEHLEELKTNQQQILLDAKARCELHGLSPTTLLQTGNAGKEIVDTAKDHHCDLIVVGSRKLSMMGVITQGSVSDYVMRHADCDVLIVH